MNVERCADLRTRTPAGLAALLRASAPDEGIGAVAVAGDDRPPPALRAAMQSIVLAEEATLSWAPDAGRAAFVPIAASNDRREGMAAFLDEREPRFTGR